MSDILKKPVHPVLTKTTVLEKLDHANKLTGTSVSLPQPNKFSLPIEKREVRSRLGTKVTREKPVSYKIRAKHKLQVIYDRLPPLPKDLEPDCKSCKTSACCVAFVVPLTKMEYESGIYGDNAAKITKEAADQLKDTSAYRWSLLKMGGVLRQDKDTYYFLEGSMGMKCPYLGDSGGCTIYEDRPFTCRTYTCVGDDRITDDIRSGKQRMIGEQLYD